MNKKIIVGDIHGCYDEFIELLDKIGITDNDEIISLGDIVDRGPKSVELYDYFRNNKNAKVIIGNHERKHINGILSYSQQIVKVQFKERYEEFKDWLKTLDYYYETQEAIIVHAFFEHDKSLTEQRKDVLSGSTSGSRYLEKKYQATYWQEHYKGDKPIIYGHHVVGENPKIQHNTYGLDTGACHGGQLTALELPSFKIHQVKVEIDYWKTERTKWQIPVLEAKEWHKMSFQKIEKQLARLAYIDDKAVQDYLEKKRAWMNELLNKVDDLKDGLEKKCKAIIAMHGIENFNTHASQYSYKVMLFRIKSNNLTIAAMKQQLDTPDKIMRLERQLE